MIAEMMTAVNQMTIRVWETGDTVADKAEINRDSDSDESGSSENQGDLDSGSGDDEGGMKRLGIFEDLSEISEEEEDALLGNWDN